MSTHLLVNLILNLTLLSKTMSELTKLVQYLNQKGVSSGVHENGDLWIQSSDDERFLIKGNKCTSLVQGFHRDTSEVHTYWQPVMVERQRSTKEWI